MLSNSSNTTAPLKPVKEKSTMPLRRRIFYSIGLPVWVLVGFILAQVLIGLLIAGLQLLGVSFESINAAMLNSAAGAVIYALAIALVVGLPWLIKKHSTSKEELGLQRLPRWLDFLWTPAGMVVYLILTSIVTQLAMLSLTFVDYSQTQDTGFTQIATRPEYLVAFISLVIVAPFAEEILFRGYLFGKLQKYAPLWVAILITSLLFALVHFQWNVGLDTFALSIVLCLLRVVSGSLWPSIMLHMLKNGIAYYFLFINPSLLSTLGG